MTDTKLYKGRPVASDAIDELLQNWPIPEVSENKKKYSGRSTALGGPLEDVYIKKEVVEPPQEEEEPEFLGMTLEELEQIRQDAYDEGIKQGHEKGYIDGFEKGVEEGKEAGYKDGLDKGKQQGLEDAKPFVDEKLHVLNTALDALQNPIKQVDEQCEKELVQLAKLLAESVIFQEVKTQQDIILLALKKAINAMPYGQEEIKIHLHPDDLEIVKNAYGEAHLQEQKWHLLPEPTLDKGGCEVKTPQSSIDITLKTRIKEILDTFLHDSGI